MTTREERTRTPSPWFWAASRSSTSAPQPRQEPAAAESTGAGTVIFAVSNADGGLVRDVQSLAQRAGVKFKVLPSVSELLDGRVSVGDVRDVRITDVLGRHQIETDLDSIAGYLTGKRVLVTGAGGSIGSELCRQIHRFAPSRRCTPSSCLCTAVLCSTAAT